MSLHNVPDKSRASHNNDHSNDDHKENKQTLPSKEFVRKKLERDYRKLSNRTREVLNDRYKNIMQVLFVK